MGLKSAVKKQLHIDESRQVRKEMKWLLRRIWDYRSIAAMVSILGLMGTAMSLGSSVASKYMIDAVTGRSMKAMLSAGILMAALLLLGLGLQSLSTWVGASARIKVRNQVQHRVYGRILRASWQNLQDYQSGDLLNRLNSDVNYVTDGIVSFLPGVLSVGVRFLGALAIMFYYDPGTAVIALLGAPATFLLSRALLKKLRQHELAMKELTGEVMSFQEDSLRNLTSIKAFSATHGYEDEMERLQSEYRSTYLSFSSFRISMSACISLVSMLVTAACLGWGVYRLWNGAISYGSLVLFLQLASALRSAFSSLVSLAQQAVSIGASAGRVIALEELPEEDLAVPDGFAQERELTVSVKDAGFRYMNGDDVLSSFDFTARPGELIAVTGSSGEGKTTLLRLLLGLVDPCKGTAELIGGSGKHYRITAGTRGAFAYVPQGNSIISGTVAQNLRIVAPEASDEQLRQALRAACALDFVERLPDGLEHQLGAGGRGISEGQAQRLAIARALLCKAPILLLDEATSALDEGTERQLLENLQHCGLINSCILVTHRPATAAICTRTYNIQRGHVSEVRGND